jgi:hypothetical protein
VIIHYSSCDGNDIACESSGNQLTLKHKLYKNIQRMQHSKGFRNFNIIPKTFMIPNEISLFQGYQENIQSQ